MVEYVLFGLAVINSYVLGLYTDTSMEEDNDNSWDYMAVLFLSIFGFILLYFFFRKKQKNPLWFRKFKFWFELNFTKKYKIVYERKDFYTDYKDFCSKGFLREQWDRISRKYS